MFYKSFLCCWGLAFILAASMSAQTPQFERLGAASRNLCAITASIVPEICWPSGRAVLLKLPGARVSRTLNIFRLALKSGSALHPANICRAYKNKFSLLDCKSNKILPLPKYLFYIDLDLMLRLSKFSKLGKSPYAKMPSSLTIRISLLVRSSTIQIPFL